MTWRQGWIRLIVLLAGALLVMALVAVGFANAGVEKAGTTAANFLTLGAGPRIQAMGGATLGLGNDVAGAAWNPASLGWLDETAITVSHSGLENQSLQEWMGIGGQIGKSGSRWAISGIYQGDGSFEGRDASNNPTGTFSASSFAIGGQLAQQLGGVATLGVGFKTVYEKLGDVSGTGTTFDGGLSLRRGIVGVGIAAQNVGGHMAFPGAQYEFPANVGAGVAFFHPSGISVALDANFPSAYYNDVRAGIEYRYKEVLALRGGYRHELEATDDPWTGATFGAGAGSNGFWIDYGFLLSGSGANGQHRVAVTLLPGKWNRTGHDPFGQDEMPRDFEDGSKRKGAAPPPGKKK